MVKVNNAFADGQADAGAVWPTFGGVFYLFVRGITPKPHENFGIWFDKPPVDFTGALNDYFGRSLKQGSRDRGL